MIKTKQRLPTCGVSAPARVDPWT